jgi:hypothetical protein
MTDHGGAFEAAQRARWLRPDAERCCAPMRRASSNPAPIRATSIRRWRENTVRIGRACRRAIPTVGGGRMAAVVRA